MKEQLKKIGRDLIHAEGDIWLDIQMWHFDRKDDPRREAKIKQLNECLNIIDAALVKVKNALEVIAALPNSNFIDDLRREYETKYHEAYDRWIGAYNSVTDEVVKSDIDAELALSELKERDARDELKQIEGALDVLRRLLNSENKS